MENKEARNELARVFEEMGGEISAWVLREGYSPELAFMTACHELGRHGLRGAITIYEKRFGDEQFGLVLGEAMLQGCINYNPEVVKLLFEYYGEERQRPKTPLQTGTSEEEKERAVSQIFRSISIHREEGNTHGLLRDLEDALRAEDAEAIAVAAKSCEAAGVPRGLTKVMILLSVREHLKQKNVWFLVDVAEDLFEYVKEYLKPEFVKSKGA